MGAETYTHDEGATTKNMRGGVRLETDAVPAEPLVLVAVHTYIPLQTQSHR